MNTQTSVVQSSSAVKPLYRGTQIVWYVLSIIEVLLVFRFLLTLIAANPAAGFSAFIYTLSYPFAVPFLYVMRSTSVAASTFEWTTLLAMLVYWIIAWGVVRLMVMGNPVTKGEAHDKLQQQDS